jgi:hypothetical protein
MVVLQIFLYSIMRAVTFRVVPLKSYMPSPAMLPLLETQKSFFAVTFSTTVTFYEHFLCPEIFIPSRQTFNFGKSQKVTTS